MKSIKKHVIGLTPSLSLWFKQIRQLIFTQLSDHVYLFTLTNQVRIDTLLLLMLAKMLTLKS